MKKIAPSEIKKQELEGLLMGRIADGAGEELVSDLVKLSVGVTLQEALEKEQAEHLGRERYERSGGKEQKLYRNGYENGTLKTAEGVINVQLPQVRGGEEAYRSALWTNMSSTSEHLKNLVIEMYARGMSQRDIEQALEASVGQFVLSKSSVSELSEALHEQYETFKGRDLGGFDVAYLFIDAVYEPLRRYGSKTGVMCAWSILEDGSKVLLDLTLANNESFEASMDFLRSMVQRGLKTPLTVTTDGAPGLTKAVEAIWPRSKRIRCWFHKMQNLQQKIPPEAWPEFKAMVQDMRDAPNFEKGLERFEEIQKLYQRTFPEACRCLADDTEASLNHLHVPPRHRQLVRTTNLVERSFVEERRRTKTIPHLWDERSLTKLVFAVLIRVSERWAKKQFSDVEQKMIRKLRIQLLGNDVVVRDKKTKQLKRRSAARAA